MINEASQATGLDDFGDDWFLTPLRAWAEDLRRPGLTDFGRRFLRAQAVNELGRRLRVLDVLRRNPEIADVPLPPVVYVTGFARSGTTLLHNALACHERSRPLRRWELVEPVPPPEAATYDSDPRIARVQAAVNRQRGTLLEQMHWVEASDPEECPGSFIDATGMLGQGAGLFMPAWGRVLSEEDMTRTFRHHRSVVQLLLWRNPPPRDGFLVLKAPQIAAQAPAFARVFPEAHFVVTHRDPFRCTVSLAVLGDFLARACFDESPLAADGEGPRVVLDTLGRHATGIVQLVDGQPARVTSVDYRDLVDDPGSVAVAVFDAAGCSPDAGLRARVAALLQRQRDGGRAAPPAELDPHGYTRGIVESNPGVKAYLDRFGTAAESSRRTGVHRSG